MKRIASILVNSILVDLCATQELQRAHVPIKRCNPEGIDTELVALVDIEPAVLKEQIDHLVETFCGCDQ